MSRTVEINEEEVDGKFTATKVETVINEQGEVTKERDEVEITEDA